MDVSVVITGWNSRPLLEKNLPFVMKAAQNPGNKIREIIFVDDFSSDDSVVFVGRNYPAIKVIAQARNFGYSVTCNTGVQTAKGDLVVILNADVVPKDDFLEGALARFRDPQVFAVTFNEGRYGPGKLVWKDGFLEIERTFVSKEPSLTDWANGGSSIFRKSVWQKLGGMDRLFLPFYFEDIDLGIRARKKGYFCWWEPEAKVEHKHEATINPENFVRYRRREDIGSIKERNHLLLTWKNIDSPRRLGSHLYRLFKKCLFHPGYLKIVFLALRRKL